MTDIDRPALDGELIDLPPEPPHDHIMQTGDGEVFEWTPWGAGEWSSRDSEGSGGGTWEKVVRRALRPITVYAPIKEYK